MATKEQLAQILGNAKKLCNENADRVMDSMKKGEANASYFNDPDPASYNDFDDSIYLSEAQEASKGSDIEYRNNAFDNSALPSSIKESFMRKQIDVSAMNPERPVLDTIGITAQPKPQPKAKPQRQVLSLNETNGQAVMTPSAAIDYNYLKYIINECLNEYFQKQPLNESNNLKTIGLKEGKINLVDNKGNIYSAELTYKGNTKDKKK